MLATTRCRHVEICAGGPGGVSETALWLHLHPRCSSSRRFQARYNYGTFTVLVSGEAINGYIIRLQITTYMLTSICHLKISCGFTVDGNCNRLLREPVDQCNTGGVNGKQVCLYAGSYIIFVFIYLYDDPFIGRVRNRSLRVVAHRPRIQRQRFLTSKFSDPFKWPTV